MRILKLVFSNHLYLILACFIFVALFVTLLIISEYVFLEPYVVGHIPPGTELGFLLIMTVSVLSGLVIPMNVYRIKNLHRSKTKIGGGMFASFVGSIAGACSCGPLGFAIISTFGSIGGVASTFLTNYEIPIRLGAIVLLGIVYYTTSRSLKMECRIHT